MARKLIFLLCAMAVTLSSCGRQVTPNRTGAAAHGLKPGQMEIKFTMASPMNFVTDWYVLAFDVTCTDVPVNCMPYAPYGTASNNWRGWDYEIVVYQVNQSSPVQASMFEFTSQQTANGFQKVPYQITGISPVQLQINPNCRGDNMQLCVIVDRALFRGVAFGGATPAPPSNIWYVNWIVASPSGTPQGQTINAPGTEGPNDTEFVFPESGNTGLNVSQAFDLTWTALQPPTWPAPTDPASQYAGGEVINNP